MTTIILDPVNYCAGSPRPALRLTASSAALDSIGDYPASHRSLPTRLVDVLRMTARDNVAFLTVPNQTQYPELVEGHHAMTNFRALAHYSSFEYLGIAHPRHVLLVEDAEHLTKIRPTFLSELKSDGIEVRVVATPATAPRSNEDALRNPPGISASTKAVQDDIVKRESVRRSDFGHPTYRLVHDACQPPRWEQYPALREIDSQLESTRTTSAETEPRR